MILHWCTESFPVLVPRIGSQCLQVTTEVEVWDFQEVIEVVLKSGVVYPVTCDRGMLTIPPFKGEPGSHQGKRV
jgi:hypothetical protein